jgi:mannose-6-phosphate isomerase
LIVDKPIRLTPSLRERVWGRKSLAPWFPDANEPVGEAWYLLPEDACGRPADCDLPLLVKLIFTSERLSVQVHPDDGEGVRRGKTEMWHILEAEPGAAIALGFREPVTRQRLLDATRTGEIEDLLKWIPVKPGETYFTPAHTVHAIGAGIVLCEIQQNCDVTYRLWDYGRAREIHVDQAIAIADLDMHPGPARPKPIADGRELLVDCKHFATEIVRLRPGERLTLPPETSHIWVCLEGRGLIGGEPVMPGEVCLVPETAEAEVGSLPGARFLRSYISPG